MKQYSFIKNKHFKLYTYAAVIAVWVLSTLYTLGQNVQESIDRYHTTATALRVIEISLALPTLFIYLAVTFAAVTFLTYSVRIRDSREEMGYKKLAAGLVITLAYFAVSAIINLFQNRYSTGQGLTNYTIIRNYVYILLNLGIYWYFWHGSRQLVATLKSKVGLAQKTTVAQAMIVVLSVIYTYLVFHNPYRTSSANVLIKPTYALPDILILITVILPYLLTWTLAAMSVVNLTFYAKNVSGIVFKQLFRDLARGFWLIIALTISLQMITQFADFWANTGLQGILVFIGVIYFALVVAYLQFGFAANKLDRIETL